jgi:hypothetical protein
MSRREPAGEEVWENGRVFWQEGDDDGERLPEAAVLIHTESAGGAIVLQQEDRYVILSRSADNLKLFKSALDAVYKASKGDP